MPTKFQNRLRPLGFILNHSYSICETLTFLFGLAPHLQATAIACAANRPAWAAQKAIQVRFSTVQKNIQRVRRKPLHVEFTVTHLLVSGQVERCVGFGLDLLLARIAHDERELSLATSAVAAAAAGGDGSAEYHQKALEKMQVHPRQMMLLLLSTSRSAKFIATERQQHFVNFRFGVL